MINAVNNTNMNPVPSNLPVINLNNNNNRQSQPYQQKLPIVYQQPIVSSNPPNNNYGTYHSLGTGLVHFQGQSPRSSNSPSSYLYSFSGQPNQIPSQLFPQSSPTIINNLNQTNSRISNVTITNTLNGTNQSTPMSTISGPSSNYNITPLKPSIIDQTRPSVNIFPQSSYINKTKIDENIIIVTEDEL